MNLSGKIFPVIASALLLFSASASAVTGGSRMIVIPAELKYQPFVTPMEEISATVAEVEKYLNRQFPDGTEFQFDIAAKVELQDSLRYKTPFLAVIDACRAANKAVDFSVYDSNGDGEADNVIIITSGGALSPQHYFLKGNGSSIRLDGMVINSYSLVPEFFDGQVVSAGLLTHEIGHALGLPDFYDTDGQDSEGLAEGMGGLFCLMDKGNLNNKGENLPPLTALERHLLGTGVCDTLSVGRWSLKDIETSNRYVFCPTDTEDEFFLLEVRKESGLAITHADRSATNDAGFSTYYGKNLTAANRWELNQINCNPGHECAKLILRESDAVTSFSSDSSPAFRYWNGHSSPLALTDIHREADSGISFTVIEPISYSVPQIYQDEIIFSFTVDSSLLDGLLSVSVSWKEDGKPEITQLCSAGPDGEVTLRISGLGPHTQYLVTARITTADAAYSLSRLITTAATDARNSIPFILFPEDCRHTDGCFIEGSLIPLKVYNATEAVSVKWLFNDTPAKADANGYFRIESSGILKAELEYGDGSSDIICKEMSVR